MTADGSPCAIRAMRSDFGEFRGQENVGCRSPKSFRLPEVGFKVQTEYARCVQRRQRNKEKG